MALPLSLLLIYCNIFLVISSIELTKKVFENGFKSWIKYPISNSICKKIFAGLATVIYKMFTEWDLNRKYRLKVCGTKETTVLIFAALQELLVLS